MTCKFIAYILISIQLKKYSSMHCYDVTTWKRLRFNYTYGAWQNINDVLESLQNVLYVPVYSHAENSDS